MKHLTTIVLSALLLIAPALCRANDGLTYTQAEDGSTVARNAAGAVLWQRYPADAGSGLRRESASPAVSASASMPAWDPLTQLDPTFPSYLRGPPEMALPQIQKV